MAEQEEALRDLERRVLASQYKELNLWRDGNVFSVGKGINGEHDKWYIYTAKQGHILCDTIDEVFDKAEQEYPEISQWIAEFNDR